MGRSNFCLLRIFWAALNSSNVDFQDFSGLVSSGLSNMACHSLFPAVHQNEPSLRNSVVSFACFVKFKFVNAFSSKGKVFFMAFCFLFE